MALVAFPYFYLLDLRRLVSSTTLLYRTGALCLYLEDRGVKCRVTKFLRKRRTAHRWSTAHNIVSGRISMGALRALEGGKDEDGNVWYRPEWDSGCDAATSASACAAVRENAVHLGPPGTVYTEEGYEPGDRRRRPNLSDVPISRHVYGLAVDLLVDWERLGGAWSETAVALVGQFGLVRPVHDEEWHLELGGAPSLAASSLRVLVWACKLATRRLHTLSG